MPEVKEGCSSSCCCHGSCSAHSHEHEHNHSHSHGHGGCSCGEHEESSSAALFAGLLLIAASLFMRNSALGLLLMTAGTLIFGLPLFKAGAANLMRLKFEELGLLTVAVGASFALSVTSAEPFEVLFEAGAVTVLFRLGEYLEDKAVEKSRRAIRELTLIRPDTVNLVGEDGEETETPAADISVGSVIALHPGERLALDCVVISGEAWVDCSAVTGESMPVHAAEGSALPSGALSTDGLLVCRTTAEFTDSTASRILRLVEDASATRGETETMITRFSAVYTPAVLFLAAVLAFLPPLLGMGGLGMWLPRALIFLVASCPCAFVISVPLTFLSGLGACSRLGVLIKGTVHLETLSRADAALFDKTGTLTCGTPEVRELILFGEADREEVLSLAAAAESTSDHPAARAVCAYAGGRALSPDSMREIPGRGVEAVIGFDTVLCGSRELLQQAGIDVCGGFDVYIAKNGCALGAFSLSDSARESAKEAVSRLRALGFETVGLLSGDNRENAEDIGKLLSLDTAEGALLPEDKAARVSALKAKGRTVLFVGDGINDAPVLAAADIGMAMGLGTDAAIETADAVLMRDDLTALPAAVSAARKTVRKAKENIAFALVIKLSVLLLGALGLAEMWMAVFADVGVTLLAVLNAASLLRKTKG